MIADTQSPDMADDRPRRGAPRGNNNAVRHGLRGSKGPADALYVDQQARSLRKSIEHELEARGEKTLYREALLQSCMRHETRALLAAKWLRDNFANLDLEKRLALTATISRATDDRDKCLQRMGLDARDSAGTMLSSFYATPLIHDAEPPASPQTSADDSKPPGSLDATATHPEASYEPTAEGHP